jgi:hypothetical protein
MIAPASVEPATAASVNRLQGTDRLGRLINSTAKLNSQSRQAYRLVRAHWIVVHQNNGWQRSIPVFIRRAVPIVRSEAWQ